MNTLELANLAPGALVGYLIAAIAEGRDQAAGVHSSLAPAFNQALDRAQIATARVRQWASRRTPTPAVATNSIGAIYAKLNNYKPRSVARNDADIAAPVDGDSDAIGQALEALAEAGAILTRSAAGKIDLEESAAPINRAKAARTR